MTCTESQRLLKILICTRGSWGDVLPYLSIARGMKQLGHDVLMVVNAQNLATVNKHGIACVAFDVHQDKDEKASVKGLTQSFWGSLKVLQKLSWHLKLEVSCIRKNASDCDLIVGSQTSLAAPLVARAIGKPWVYSAVSPMALLSFEDPPYLHGLHWLDKKSVLPNWWKALLRRTFFRLSDAMYVEYRRLELEFHLPHKHPLLEGRYSPWLNLALFSPLLAKPQLDWPVKTLQCGYVKSASETGPNKSDQQLLKFLEAGSAPVVFTLGSVARLDPGDFYDLAVKATVKLGLRAVLVKRDKVPLHVNPGASIYVCGFADYPLLFKAAQIVVHHGGVATLMEVMKAGKPSLIVPRTLDQFDQAMRAKKLGVAEVLPFNRLSESRLVNALTRLIAHSDIAQHLEIAQAASQESGAQQACFEIDRLLTQLGVEG